MNEIQQYIFTYPKSKYSKPMNRLFFDHGQDQVLRPILESIDPITEEADPVRRTNVLTFLQDSLREYQKSSWRTLLENEIKEKLSSLSVSGNYFERVLAVQIIHQLAHNDQDKLEEYYQQLQHLFHVHFEEENDPLLLVTIFTELNTKYGGTWVYDYEIDMVLRLINHESAAMKIAGLECFNIMRPDHDEVPESLWELTDRLKKQYPIDFFDLRMTFEQNLQDRGALDYKLDELEGFIKSNFEIIFN